MQVQNPDTLQNAKKSAGLSAIEGYPQNVSPNMSFVIDTTPRVHRVVNVSEQAASGTVYTVPTGVEFFLTGYCISFSKAVGDSGSVCALSTKINNITKTIAKLAGITLTAERGQSDQDFCTPLKVDDVATIDFTLTGAFTSSSCVIRGYFVTKGIA